MNLRRLTFTCRWRPGASASCCIRACCASDDVTAERRARSFEREQRCDFLPSALHYGEYHRTQVLHFMLYCTRILSCGTFAVTRCSSCPRQWRNSSRCSPLCTANVRPLAFHATWNPTFYISPISNITFHVARFLRDSLYASNIRYNGLHLFSGSYGHADRPDPA